MPEVSRFYGIVIKMYWDDHNPPHFHAEYAENEIVVEISTLQILQGSLPRRALAMVMDWAAQHQAELLRDWQQAVQKVPLTKIDPLP